VGTFFEQLGLRRVVNGAGKLTMLGASTQSPAVIAAMSEGAQHFVDLAELMAVADRLIAQATGAEAGFVTSCAAAGITIATAACLTRGNLARTERLPLPPGPPDEMIVQGGHLIHFGAALTQMLALAGAQVAPIGAVNRTLPHQLRQAIHERTAGVLFVVSHHTHQNGAIPLEEVVRLAHARDVPVVVDAAAELDLHKYIAAGADLVIYSGHKSLNAPTSGLIGGRRDLIDACHQQNSGIGRTMKIGKENIIGCLAALHEYIHASGATDDGPRAQAMLTLLEDIAGLRAEIVRDPTRSTIVRVRLHVQAGQARYSARELLARLADHSPSIRLRSHALEHGQIDIDFRPLRSGDEAVIAAALRDYLAPEASF
jgi:L-seryl-tRNA(Ser) seleniumtransferase/D-glucosaminate-6-phosphate ammonia-lyase